MKMNRLAAGLCAAAMLFAGVPAALAMPLTTVAEDGALSVPIVSTEILSESSGRYAWGEIAGATGYQYDLSFDLTFATSYASKTTDKLTIKLNNLVKGIPYYIRVRSVQGEGDAAVYSDYFVTTLYIPEDYQPTEATTAEPTTAPTETEPETTAPPETTEPTAPPETTEPTEATAPTEPVVPTGLGDVNGDSLVNASDATDVLIAAAAAGAGDQVDLNAAQREAADVDGDGSCNASDATVILQYAAYSGAGGTDPMEVFVKS